MIEIRRERFSSIASELPALLTENWKETGEEDEINMRPDWQRYLALEEQDMLEVAAARDQGVLAGYCISIISPSLHYRGNISAHVNVIYLLPRCRVGLNGYRLLKFGLGLLDAREVRIVYMYSSKKKNIHKILLRLGFKERETVYWRVRGDGGNS